MVLWEITAITAYFLGLKRTYRLALRIQRRLIGANHPRIREFVHRPTRSAFDVAIKVHKHIQQRDIEVGRNLGNWILRWLDRMKPSAQIRPHPVKVSTSSSDKLKHVSNSSQPLGTKKSNAKVLDQQSNGRLNFTPLNIQPKSFPTVALMMQPAKPAGTNIHYRHMASFPSYASVQAKRMDLLEGIFRKDIAQLLLQ
ncbi:uncharacterized protein [Typha latifolia]|uniref:uncharacterized protein n=1 Tax=Typha latifolia TaxID=4733 RepID=UPI003C2FC6D9